MLALADVSKSSSLRGHHPSVVRGTEGKHILSEHCALWQERGMAATDKLCTFDFTRAWLGSQGRLCQQWLPTFVRGVLYKAASSLLACQGLPSCHRAPLSGETQAVVLGMQTRFLLLRLTQWLIYPNQLISSKPLMVDKRIRR